MPLEILEIHKTTPRKPLRVTCRTMSVSPKRPSRRKKQMIHHPSGHALSVREEGEGIYALFSAPQTIKTGDRLYYLSEKYRPSQEDRSDDPQQSLKNNGWIWVDSALPAMHADCKRIDSVLVSTALYQRLTQWLLKYSSTAQGADYNNCIKKLALPPFILDMYLRAHKDEYYKKAGHVYRKNFDYRKVLSPFASGILKDVESRGYVRVKDILALKNSEQILQMLQRLDLVVLADSIYLVDPVKAAGIPVLVREARKENPQISLQELASMASVPKNVLLSILRITDETI